MRHAQQTGRYVGTARTHDKPIVRLAPKCGCKTHDAKPAIRNVRDLAAYLTAHYRNANQ